MDRNICKFIMPGSSEKISVHNFIYETNKETAYYPHKNLCYRAYLALSNDGFFVINNKEYPVKKGSIYFTFPNETVFVKDTEAPEYMYISFEGGRVSELFFRFGITASERIFSSNESLIPFWMENITRADSHNVDLVSESVLLYTFSRLISIKPGTDDSILKLIKFVEDNFQDSKLTLSSAAEFCGYHPKYLSHRFKEYTGSGFNQYLKNIRIKHALLLFDYNVDSVKNVSLLCGFNDPLYFSKIFKESVGVSPREYLTKKTNITDDMEEE